MEDGRAKPFIYITTEMAARGHHSGHCGGSGPQESVANVEVDEKGKKATQGREGQSESSFSAWV